MCHTDLHILDGHWPELALPRVLGHEIAGEAEGIGAVLVYGYWGWRIVRAVPPRRGAALHRSAEAGWARDGGCAELVLVPYRLRYLLPLQGPDPVRAAPLADAGVTPYRAVRRVRGWLEDGGVAVVIGAGGLGQFAVQCLKLLTDAHVVAVDVDEAKRPSARELGADEAASPEQVVELGRVRAVLDVVGSNGTLALSAAIVEPMGIVVQIGEAGGRLPFGHQTVPAEAHFTTAAWASIGNLEAVLQHARRGEITLHVETLPTVFGTLSALVGEFRFAGPSSSPWASSARSSGSPPSAFFPPAFDSRAFLSAASFGPTDRVTTLPPRRPHDHLDASFATRIILPSRRDISLLVQISGGGSIR